MNSFTSCIKIHGSVSCGPRKKETLGVGQTSVYFTGVKKMLFSRICRSKLPEQKHTKFSVQISLWWGTSNSKFELNPPSCSRDMRLQSSSYFLRIFFSLFFFFCNTFLNCDNSCVLYWIALKFGPLLEHIRAYVWFNFCSNWIKKHWRFSKFSSGLQVKPLAWIGWKWICSYIKHKRINLWWERINL